MSVPNEFSDEEEFQEAPPHNQNYLPSENKPNVVGRPGIIGNKVAEDDGDSDMSIPDEL